MADGSTDLSSFIKGKTLPKLTKEPSSTSEKPVFSDEFLKEIYDQMINMFIEQMKQAPTRFNKSNPSSKYLQMFRWKALSKMSKIQFYLSNNDKLLKSSVNSKFDIPVFEHDGKKITLDDAIYVKNSKGINGYFILNELAKKSGYGAVSVIRHKYNPAKPKNELHFNLIMYLTPSNTKKPSSSKEDQSDNDTNEEETQPKIEEDDI